MKSMKDLKQMFVPDHTEEILVTKGFAEPMISVEGYTGWTFQQITDWLREEKGIYITVLPTLWNDGHYMPFVRNINTKKTEEANHFKSYYSALQSGIEKSLELI
jgi:hypothetical protein